MFVKYNKGYWKERSSEGEKEETKHEQVPLQIPSTEAVKTERVVLSVGYQSVAFFLLDCQHSINKRLSQKYFEKMATQNVCSFNKFGYCKFRNNCRKMHVNENCENESCEITTWKLRHPKPCRYFRDLRRCKLKMMLSKS